MNTKYPLNGRYTSLGDIVQEYAKYSSWPTSIQPISPIIPDDEETDDEDIPQQDSNILEKKFYWTGTTQPFNELVFNNSDKAVKPYELVWFDDVYSRTEKELNTNKYKLIQESDSHIFSFGREIRAKEIANYENNKAYGIPFRFIIADSNDNNRYYFNYKTSSGEAVVLYALRNIIETCKEKSLDPSIFLFGSNGDNGITIENQDEKLYIINKLDLQKNNQEDVSILEQEIKDVYIYPSLFTYNVLKPYDNNYNNLYEYANKSTPYYTNIKYIEDQGIFDDIEKIKLSPKSYSSLGEIIWSKKHIQYPNYTTGKLPHLNNIFESNDTKNINLTLDVQIKDGNIYSQFTKNLIINENLLEKSIIYFVNDYKIHDFINNTTIMTYDNIKLQNIEGFTPNYNYIQNTAYKLFYFCKLFLNSQRFYYSYVTSMRFIRISSLSYAIEQPVLRCDLGIFQNVQSLVIKSAIHNYTTALPAGPLTLDTFIQIDIVADIKYEGMENSIEETFPLILSFKTIMDWTGSESDPVENSKNWIRLIKPNDTLPEDETEITGDKYGANNSSFIEIMYEDENNNILGDSDCSLGILRWPSNDSNLYCDTEELFISRTTNTAAYTSADTYDINTFTDINMYQNAITNKISPFGNLRIHTIYSTDSEESILNSSYYIDVSLLRHKNYFYKTSQTQTIENTELKIYYNSEVPYYDSNELIIPNTSVDIITNQQQNKTKTELDSLFSGKYFTFPLADDNTISNNENKSIYLTIKNNNGTYYVFASGAKELSDDSNNSGEQFNNIYNLDIKILTNNNWQTLSDNVYTITKNNNIYQLDINYSSGGTALAELKSAAYLQIALKQSGMPIVNAPYYYIKNTLRTPENNIQLTIKPLFINTTNVSESNERYITNILINNANELFIGFILYNSDNTYTNLNADVINFTQDNISYNLKNDNIYFKLTSVYGGQLGRKQYKNNYNKNIYLYYETPTTSKFINKLLFDKIYIGNLKQNNYNLYVAFNNIYVINFQLTSGITVNNLNNVYYGNNQDNRAVTVTNNNLIAAFNENVFLKADSFNISLDSNIKQTLKLEYVCNNQNNQKQFTYITNDMINKIKLENIIFYANDKTTLKFTNLNIPDSLDNNKKFVRVFIETLSTVQVNIKNNTDNTPINLNTTTDSNYKYFECDAGTNINISVTISSNRYYGIYDSNSGNIDNNYNKNLSIDNDTTIIIKTKRDDN